MSAGRGESEIGHLLAVGSHTIGLPAVYLLGAEVYYSFEPHIFFAVWFCLVVRRHSQHGGFRFHLCGDSGTAKR